eukprot:GHVP01067357.1.p1 GENE.GHVP01067357.1~~GHVP01067357.1.p1  ORF type:complete len:154 (+),score=26.89 GHVP01067357.1:58-519(+)
MDPTQLPLFPALHRYDEPNYPILPNHMPRTPSLYKSEEGSVIDANMPKRLHENSASNQGTDKKILAPNSPSSSSGGCDESSTSDYSTIAKDVDTDTILAKLNSSTSIELSSTEISGVKTFEDCWIKFMNSGEEVCRILVRLKITTICVIKKLA